MRVARAGGVPAAAAALVVAASMPAGAQQRAPVRADTGEYELIGGPSPLFRQDAGSLGFERALFNRTGLQASTLQGEVAIPVVLILFDDSPEVPHIGAADVQQALFDGPAPRGTITEAYREMSLEAFSVTGDTYGWVRSDLSLLDVMGTNGSLIGERTGEFFLGALQQIDSDVDFTLYDNDGPDGVANSGDDDGFVDIITFEYLEVAMSCGGPAIWPHRSRLTARGIDAFVTDDIGVNGDTIRIQDYITQSAADCSGENVQDAAVISHEFGHVLGLPDWYHWVNPELGPAGRRWVLGCWALMAGGSWGCGPVDALRAPYGPSHMMGYSKRMLGWITPTDPGEVWNDTIELSPIQTSGEALRIPLDGEGREFLWVEYRDTIGFDHALPASGVLMYKEHSFREPWFKPDPASSDVYPLMMLEQDGNASLLRIAPEGGNLGEAGDAWGVGGTSGRLDASTSPALTLSDGGWTWAQIHEVSVQNGRARVVLSTGRTPLASLLQLFLGDTATPLTPLTLAHLDQVGNANGRYDVGDLRKWLRENPR